MPNPRDLFFEDPKVFFNRYSINLPGNPQEAGKIGQVELMQSSFKPVKRAEGIGESNVKGSSMTKSFHKFKSEHGGLTVKALAHNAAWQVDDERGKATLVVRTAPATLQKTEEETAGLRWFLCLMLPWVDDGIASMKLRRGTRANAFFTGQMNGCSFVVTGDPKEPFVSHINCANPQNYENRARMVLDSSGEDTRNAMRLGRETYKLDETRRGSHEDRVRDQLLEQKRKLMGQIITDTLCFVMGRRVKGSWEFFYQRVITQQYSHKRNLGRTGRLTKFLGRDNRQIEQTVVYRALTPYTKLWPDGPGRLSM